MMREEVRVVAVKGDYAEVVGYRQSGCSGCHSKGACSMLSGMSAGQETRLWVLNSIQAEVGDTVSLEISERQFLRASFLVYILPLVILFLVGVLVRNLLLPYGSDLADGIGALAGLAAMAGFFLWLRHHTATQERYQPVITRPGFGGGSHCDSYC